MDIETVWMNFPVSKRRGDMDMLNLFADSPGERLPPRRPRLYGIAKRMMDGVWSARARLDSLEDRISGLLARFGPPSRPLTPAEKRWLDMGVRTILKPNPLVDSLRKNGTIGINREPNPYWKNRA